MLSKTRWVYFLVLLALCLGGVGCSKQARKERHLKNANRYFAAKDFKKAEIEYMNVVRADRTNAWAIKQLASIYFDQAKYADAARFLLAARELDKGNLEVRTRLAQIFLSAGQAPQARDEALYILDRSPTNDEALLTLSDSAFGATNVALAQERLLKLQTQNANRTAWHLAMAGLYLRQTNATAAESALQKALAFEPQSSRVHLAWGNFHWQQKDLKKADQEYQKAAELSPANSPVRLRWVDFKLNTGAAKQAGEILEQITQQAPNFLAAQTYLARFDFDQRKFQECSNVLEKVLVQDANNYDARLLQAMMHRIQGQSVEAVRELEAMKRFYPRSPELLLQLALAHARNQDGQKAAATLDEALAIVPDFPQATLLVAELSLAKGDAAAAVASLKGLLRRHPEADRAYLLLASAYTAQGQYDDALRIYDGLEKSFPTNASIPFLTGVEYRQQNRTAEARKAFMRAAELAPNDLLVLYQLVELDLIEKNYTAASKRIQEQLANTPRSAGAKFLEARVYAAQGDWDHAEKVLHETLDLEPNFIGAYDLLARTYVAANKLPQAAEQFEALLSKNPKNQRALMTLALLYGEMKDDQKARKTYETLLGIWPQFTPALNNFAYLWSERLGNLDKGYELARKARELAADDPATADTLGWILFKRRDYQQALVLLREGVTSARLQANPEVQFHYGMVCYMMGQTDPARGAFEQAVKSTAPFAGKEEAQRRLAWLQGDNGKPGGTSIADLEKIVHDFPDDLPARMRLAELYAKQGAADKAARAYEDSIKLNPNLLPAILKLAELEAGPLRLPDKAMELARKARSLSPEDPRVAYLLGKLTFQSGEFSRSYGLLQESARQQTNNVELLYDLAWAAFSLGRTSEAEQTMRQALAIEPQFSRSEAAKWFVAMLALARDPKEQGEAQIMQLLKVDPNHAPGLIALATIQAQRRQGKLAAENFEKVLTRFPQFAPAQRSLAALYAEDPATEQKAYDLAVKAREVLSEDPGLAIILGKLNYRRKDYRNSILFLREAGRNRPAEAETLFYLGMAHYQLKENPQSKQALEQALALGLDASLAAEAKPILAKLQAK